MLHEVDERRYRSRISKDSWENVRSSDLTLDIFDRRVRVRLLTLALGRTLSGAFRPEILNGGLNNGEFEPRMMNQG